MRNSTEGFYMCYVEGAETPKRQHFEYKNAIAEAKRLAEKTGKKTYVLGTVRAFEVQKFIETDCAVNELPF